MTDMMMVIPLDELRPSRNQPRRSLDEEVISSARAGIAKNGGKFPLDMAITVRPKSGGGFEILSGHHRVAAAQESGCSEVHAVVKAKMTDQDAMIYLAAANSHTRLTPMEHGAHIAKFQAAGGRVDQYAAACGLNRKSAYDYLWAWRVLESLGGWSSPYARTSHLVLAHVHGVKDVAQREAVIKAINASGLSQTYALDVIRNVREGMPIPEAVAAMEGWLTQRKNDRRREMGLGEVKRAPEPDAPREFKVSQEAKDKSSKSRSTQIAPRRSSQKMLEDMGAAAALNRDYTKALQWNLAMLMARCESLERTCGDRLKGTNTVATMVREVMARQPVILAELQAAEEMTMLGPEGERWAM